MSKNGKESCTCKNENFNEGIATFRLFSLRDNKFNPIYRNPREFIKSNLNNKNYIFNPDRANAVSCSELSLQQKLEIKKKPTPFRMPYNHYRKKYNCDENNNCLENVKVVKETATPCECPKSVITSRLVGKTGVRFINDTTYKNYLQNNGKLFLQNAQGLLNENKVDDIEHTFKIGNLEEGVSNKSTNTNISKKNCMVYNVNPISLTSISYSYKKIPTATKKYKNPKFASNSSVSSRSRLNRLKYNTILSGQINNSKSNKTTNCLNGEICSIYKNSRLNNKERKKEIQYNKLPCPQK